MPQGYIPQRDSDARDWYVNFSTQFATAPILAATGFLVADSNLCQTAATNFSNALTTANNPVTRTSATIAAKDAARANTSFVVRPYAQRINANPNVTNAQRELLGITIRDRNPTRNPVPVTQPLLTLTGATHGGHNLRFADAFTPASRRKPPNVIALQLFVTVTDADPVDVPTASIFVGSFGSNPVRVPTDSGDVGKMATYFGRWTNRRGQVGPWSAGASMIIV